MPLDSAIVFSCNDYKPPHTWYMLTSIRISCYDHSSMQCDNVVQLCYRVVHRTVVQKTDSNTHLLT